MTQNQIAYANAQELKRHNIATEQETNRHQQMSEALTRWANALQNYQITVNQAHYERMDRETERANRAKEAQNMIGLGETARSNAANEYIKQRSNQIESMKAAETSRHQKAVEAETERYNNALIEKAGAETEYTETQTKGEAYRTIYLLPAQAKQAEASAYLANAQAGIQPTVGYKNIMEGTASVIGAAAQTVRAFSGYVNPSAGTANAVQQSFQEIFSQLQ